MRGADAYHAEGIYGAPSSPVAVSPKYSPRRSIAVTFAKTTPTSIGRQILRDNALALFPQLQDQALEAQGPAHDAAGAVLATGPGGH